MKILTGKVAVITGAAGGIGSALALEFAEAGMDIVLADLNERGMEQLAHTVTALGRRCTYQATDVGDVGQMRRLLEHSLASYGDCHLMINNAGIIQAAGLFDVELSQWQRVIDVNLNGILYGSRVFGEYFIRKGEGHIVNVSSAAGLFPIPGMTMYTTSKYAVEGFTQQLRWELDLKGVGVTLACPGTIKSQIYEGPHVGLPLDYARVITRLAPYPKGFARKIRRAVQRNRALVRYGVDAHIFSLMRHLPMWLKEPLGKMAARSILNLLAQAGGRN